MCALLDGEIVCVFAWTNAFACALGPWAADAAGNIRGRETDGLKFNQAVLYLTCAVCLRDRDPTPFTSPFLCFLCVSMCKLPPTLHISH